MAIRSASAPVHLPNLVHSLLGGVSLVRRLVCSYPALHGIAFAVVSGLPALALPVPLRCNPATA